MMGRSDLSQREAKFLIAALNPRLGKPVCSRNPPGYSMSSGFLVGRRERKESGLVTNAPSSRPPRFPKSLKSGANPKDPAAFINGLLKYKSRFILLTPCHCERSEAIST